VESIELKYNETCENGEKYDAAGLDASNKPNRVWYRLVKEMEEIFKAQDFSMLVEPSPTAGIYLWDVYIAGFSPECRLDAELRQAGRRSGTSSVHLQITFQRGVHPYYPPSVRIISPRFIDPVMTAVVSHPILHSDFWNPVTTARDIILAIKGFLEAHARLDLGNNDGVGKIYLPPDDRCSSGIGISSSSMITYLEAERLLARLLVLTGAPTAIESLSPERAFPDVFTGQELTSLVAATAGVVTSPTAKKSRIEEETSRNPQACDTVFAWKPGTGYGSQVDPNTRAHTWDANRAIAVQNARDVELCQVLISLVDEITKVLNQPLGSPGRATLLAALEGGCLMPLLVRELSGAGFAELASRVPYYTAVLRCVQALTRQDTFALLEWHAKGDEKTVTSAMARLRSQANHFLQVLHTQTRILHEPEKTDAGGSSSVGRSRTVKDDDSDSQLASYLLEVADAVEKTAPLQVRAGGIAVGAAVRRRDGAAPVRTAQQGVVTAASSVENPGQEEVKYKAAMAPYIVRIMPGIASNHKYQLSARNEATAPTKVRAKTIAKELASMESDLPFSTSSAVLVVADETSSVLWKAMMTGPRDTPYEGGVFLFDIYFPGGYPSSPPKVTNRTTGGGTVRFNPNLYNDGKVCLSLLGTWSGDKGESWIPDVSSMRQVLLSIQSMILVEKPFYNEPGYEMRPDDAQSNAYNANIMEQTVRWAMLDQLRSPPAYFKEPIEAHFKERGAAIVAVVKGWVDWCQRKGFENHAKRIQQMVPTLEEKIKMLGVGGRRDAVGSKSG